MDYSAHMIARSEHNLRVRSIPPVYECGEHVLPAQPGRVHQFLTTLLKRVTVLQKRHQPVDEMPVLSHTEVAKVQGY